MLTGCNSEEVIILRGQTMGTYWQVSVAEKMSTTEITELDKKIQAELLAVNQQMSTFIADSEISRFNNSPDAAVEISSEMSKVVAAALQISAESDGKYDITVLPLVELWGFAAKKVEKKPTDEEIAAVLPLIGYQKLHLDGNILRKDNPAMRIDLSSIAKGYGVDKLAELLVKENRQNFLVDIGGEVRAVGNKFGKAWKIAVEVPENRGANSIAEVLDLTDKSLATSGNYRNFIDYDGERAVHTIDPRTGRGAVSNLLSVTVAAENCMLADGYATALMAIGGKDAEKFAEKQKLAVLFIFADEQGGFSVRKNKHWQDIFIQK